jgi:hypothetical protein
MAIKLADTLAPMADFPAAMAEHIEFSDGETLQKKLDDGTLGSGGGGATYIELSQEEYDALGDDEKVNGLEYRTYDTGHIYKLGVSFGKETDISSKQDSLSQVKFTMRRNSASEGRYCLIGSSDLSQNLLMCEPYRFQGIFGDGTTSVENKSIIDFMVSFREGVGNPDEVLSGFANSSKGFDYVDLLITTDETTNTAYAYVDFKTSGSVATGEITKPVLEAESYMDFAELFELTDTYIGTLVCKMSDYAKIITNIDDETTSTDTVWSSKKTSDEIAKHSLPLVFDSGVRGNAAIEIYKLSNVTYEATGGEHPYNLNLLLSTRAGEEVELFGGKNDSGWKLFARKNNDYASKIMDIYLDGYDVYVRLATYYNFFKVYHKNGALRSDFAVTKVTSIPDTATEIPITAPGVMDNQTSTESTWSSSKIAQQINSATTIKYDNVINANATKETDWSLAQGESHFYGRLLQLDGHLGSKSSTFSFLLFVKANYDNPTTVYVTQLAGMDDDRTNIAHTTYFELGVSSSGNLTIKNKSAVAASYRFI